MEEIHLYIQQLKQIKYLSVCCIHYKVYVIPITGHITAFVSQFDKHPAAINSQIYMYI